MKSVSVLVDEPVVRNLLHRILERKGFMHYDFAECAKPAERHTCDLACAGNHAPPDLLIIEVVVPRSCTGIEAARKALDRWPDVKILLTSATPADFWPPEDRKAFAQLPEASHQFLPKPFTLKDFETALEELGILPRGARSLPTETLRF